MSFNFTNGRQSYLDTYNAGALVLTIKNQADESAGFTFGDVINLLSPTGAFQYRFYVVEIGYNDYNGNTGLSTATITCQDALGLMGRLQMNQFAVTAGFAGQQFADTQLVPGFKTNQPRLGWVGSGYGSLCSAATYSGSLLNFYNLLVNTERTFLRIWQEELTFFSRNAIGVFGV